MGHSRGVMTFMRLVMLAVTESDPTLEGLPPLPVALVMAAPFKQWNATARVAPAVTDPAGGPSWELSRDAWFAMVVLDPPEGGIELTTVTATGPPPDPEQIALAVGCWYWETAMRSACRTELVTASRK